MQQNSAKDQGQLNLDTVGHDACAAVSHGETDQGIGQGVEAQIGGHVYVLEEADAEAEDGGFEFAGAQGDVDQDQEDQIRLDREYLQRVHPGSLQDESQNEQQNVTHRGHIYSALRVEILRVVPVSSAEERLMLFCRARSWACRPNLRAML